MEQQARDLLPVHYFHVVFTVPAACIRSFCGTGARATRCSSAAVWERFSAVCRRRLGATPGTIAVLHTWSQTLAFHPHVHCIVTGRRARLERSSAGSQPPRLPGASARPLECLPRQAAGGARALDGVDRIASAGTRLLRQAAAKDWVVYSKAPMAGPQQVLRYLGRYTHRIAIGNERLVSIDEGHVTFRYRDRRRGNRACLLTVTGSDFVRRFLLHVLPSASSALRHFGSSPMPHRSARIAKARSDSARQSPLSR